MKMRPVGTELFHADWRTDMTKLTVAFPNYDNAPKNWPDEKWSHNQHQDYISVVAVYPSA